MKLKNWLIVVGVLIVGIIFGVGLNRFTTSNFNSSSNKIVKNSAQVSSSTSTSSKQFENPVHTQRNAKRVFINASMNTDGTTSEMGKKLFGSLPYKQINLRDYDIPQIGQGEGDFNKVWSQLKDADVIVIGTPVYWSNMSGYLTTFIDHMQINNDLKNADLYAIVQGADSNQTAAINSTYGSLNRISIRFKMHFVGIAQTDSQIQKMHQKMIGK